MGGRASWWGGQGRLEGAGKVGRGSTAKRVKQLGKIKYKSGSGLP